jgi:hypothetical protein
MNTVVRKVKKNSFVPRYLKAQSPQPSSGDAEYYGALITAMCHAGLSSPGGGVRVRQMGRINGTVAF